MAMWPGFAIRTEPRFAWPTPTDGFGLMNGPSISLWPSSSIPLTANTTTMPPRSALLDQLVERMPAESLIALEAGRTLDDQILPDFDAWDIRRYGDTQIAVRVFPGPDEESADA